jgi:hypothetical protein
MVITIERLVGTRLSTFFAHHIRPRTSFLSNVIVLFVGRTIERVRRTLLFASNIAKMHWNKRNDLSSIRIHPCSRINMDTPLVAQCTKTRVFQKDFVGGKLRLHRLFLRGLRSRHRKLLNIRNILYIFVRLSQKLSILLSLFFLYTIYG